MEANASIIPYVPIEDIGGVISWVVGCCRPPAASGAYYGGNPMMRVRLFRKNAEQRSLDVVINPVGPPMTGKEGKSSD